MSAPRQAAVQRAAASRKARVNNYLALILALGDENMTVYQMAQVIGTKPETARRYLLAMQHKRIAQIISNDGGRKKNTSSYCLCCDQSEVRPFLEFIATRETVEDEIDQPPRRREEIGDLGRRIVVNVKATQRGVRRHWMDLALFGDGPAHSVVAA